MRWPIAVHRGLMLSALVAATLACSNVTQQMNTASSTSVLTSQQLTPYPKGASLHNIKVNGITRKFLIHVPEDIDVPRAIVFVLHGGGGEGLNISTVGRFPMAEFRTVGDREGFIVVYPEGLPARDRQGLAGWTDCRADNSVSSGSDDVGFLASLVSLIGTAYQLPSTHLFMAGSSNGGQMTQAFAFHHPEMLGAIASSVGSLPASPLPGPCTTGPSESIPILLSHGTDDPQMPFGGGCVANIGGGCNRGRVVSAEATRERWLTINNLTTTEPVQSTVDVNFADSGPAQQFLYTGPSPVEWWRLDGAGHASPSKSVLVTTSRIAGIQNRDIEFAEVAWAFFKDQLPPK